MVYSEEEIQKISAAGKKLAEVMAELEPEIKAGVSTLALDEIARRIIEKKGGRPSFLNYQGYPSAICASIGSEVVHGIPSKDKILIDGDIVGIDIGLELDGYFADMAKTFQIGKVSAEAKKLCSVTEQALQIGIREAKEGNTIGDLGNAVQDYIESQGLSVVRDLVGHGVGKSVHEEPNVPNFGKKGTGIGLRSGMVLAIEPMVNAGDFRIKVLDDGWTVVTADNALSAHFEHTVLVTPLGGKILTDLENRI